ncbi:MAG TPA: hypothetical protein VNL39_11775 [Xanthobacteraceae bacterium]|nr:hypothetical protein [Xanthobacteraceae bacterium]
MTVDLFNQRLNKVRARFAANVERKIETLDNTLPQLCGEGNSIIERLAAAHRSVHALCGVGPTIGFVATGRAARTVEQILRQSLKAKRGLTDLELASVRAGLVELRAAAHADAQISAAER